jgi:histidyl-tRNA synthetase
LAEKLHFKAIKGVRDILPPESALWNRVEQTAREVFGTFGFAEIRLPIFEESSLFARSIGAETDVVSKEMYTFYDPFDSEEVRWKHFELLLSRKPGETETQDEWMKERRREFEKLPKGDVLSLRPEATASVVRAYIEHGMQTLPGNVKLYYMGPMFRRERPQKGRYRQFYQIGAEVLGPSDAPGIDAEVIEMLLAFFERLKLKGAVLNINSIGDKNCRPAYVERLRAELQVVREQLGADSQRRIESNPLRVLDSKLEHEQAIIEKLPRIADHLCEPCREHYAEVKKQLALRGIAYQENWRLVRGLDYYMRTTFEITAPGLGSQNAVCGGGRYDGLVELLGGPATTKGIGFAIGTDRLVLSLQESGAGEVAGVPARLAGGPARSAGGLDVYLAWFGAPAQPAAVGLARRLRDAGFVVELPAVEMKFGKSLGLADRLKARHAVILSEDELAAGVVAVKRLADGTQQKLAEQDLFSYLRAARAASD